MKPILFVFFLIFITGCVENTPENNYSPKSRLINEISIKAAMQLKREKNLRPCGFGSEAMHQIHMLALSFDYYNQINIEEARDLIITAGNLFLKKINENEQIRPYLNKHPFLPKNIEIRIFLYKKNSSNLEIDDLKIISLTEGIIRYKVGAPKGKFFETILTETFDEATAKLNQYNF